MMAGMAVIGFKHWYNHSGGKVLSGILIGTGIVSAEHNSCFEDKKADDELAILETHYLIQKANRRSIPIPSYSTEGMWKQCGKNSDQYVLTNQGSSQLRSSLQKETKERIRLIVMTLIFLAGIIVSMTGLLAVIMYR